MKRLFHPENKPLFVRKKESVIVTDGRAAWKSAKRGYKKKIKSILLPYQKHLCAYCEIELSELQNNFGFHIEHVKPKSLYPQDTFKFENLVLSCFKTGSEVNKTTDDLSPVSCGHYKKSNYNDNLFIKPTDDIENLFYYEINGKVIPNQKITDQELLKKIEYTIECLNLNCHRLVRQRKSLIVEGLSIINELNNNTQAIRLFIELEIGEANSKTFPFISLRKQHFIKFLN